MSAIEFGLEVTRDSKGKVTKIEVPEGMTQFQAYQACKMLYERDMNQGLTFERGYIVKGPSVGKSHAKLELESDESLRERVQKKMGPGATYTAEDLAGLSGINLTIYAETRGIQRRYGAVVTTNDLEPDL